MGMREFVDGPVDGAAGREHGVAIMNRPITCLEYRAFLNNLPADQQRAPHHDFPDSETATLDTWATSPTTPATIGIPTTTTYWPSSCAVLAATPPAPPTPSIGSVTLT